MTELSDYEVLRQTNIQRNLKFLEDIGIAEQKPKKSRGQLPPKRKIEETDAPPPSRRSLRVAQLDPVDYKVKPQFFLF
jgi:hypothetical protein